MRSQLLRRRGSQAGFNLIEVSLALAICSVGLITLCGLLPTGIDASRRAADDTLVTSLASDILHWRRISPFSNSTFLPYGSPPLDTRGTVSMVNDAMGNFNVDEFGATNPYFTGPYFLTTYTVMDHPQFGGALDAARVVITIEWPYNAPSANRTKRTFISDYARMQ